MVNIARIEGATRFLGKEQGYYELPLRDERRAVPVGDKSTLIVEARGLSRLTEVDNDIRALLTALADALELLPLLDKVENYTVPGPDTPVMVTAWTPTPGELIALNNGANIHVEIVGVGHPPIMVKIGPMPD